MLTTRANLDLIQTVSSQKRSQTQMSLSTVIHSAHAWDSKAVFATSVQTILVILSEKREFRVNQLIHATEISALVIHKNILKVSLLKVNSQENKIQLWIIQILLLECKKRQKRMMKRLRMLRKMQIPIRQQLNQIRLVMKIKATVQLHLKLNQITLVKLKKQKKNLKDQLLIQFQRKPNKTRILKLCQIIQQVFQSPVRQ